MNEHHFHSIDIRAFPKILARSHPRAIPRAFLQKFLPIGRTSNQTLLSLDLDDSRLFFPPAFLLPCALRLALHAIRKFSKRWRWQVPWRERQARCTFHRFREETRVG